MTAMASDPFWPNYPASGSVVVTPDMVFCGLMPTGDPIVFVDSRICCNLGEFGRTGASKTCYNYMIVRQFVKKGYTVVVFQQKNEYDDWATDPGLEGKVLPLRFSDFKIALGQAARGVDQKHHIHTLFDDLARSSGRLYSQRLGEDIFTSRSRNLPNGLYLPFSLFMEAIVHFRPGPGSVEGYYKESMLYTLKDLKNCFGDIFDYYYSEFLDRLFEWRGLIPVTVDVPVGASTFFITHVVRHEYERRKSSSEDPESFTPIVIVLEDGTMLTDEKELGGMSPLVPMTFMSRRYNIGFIYCGHSISGSVSQKLISNLESICLFGISGEDPRRIQTLLGCSEDQARMVQLLRPGEYIAMIPSFLGRPIYGQFPYIKPPRKLTEEERQNIIRPFLETVKAVKYIDRGLPVIVDSAERSGHDGEIPSVDSEELKFLVLAGTGKRLTKTQLYEQLPVTRRRGKQIFDRLERKGLVRSRSFGRAEFPEVLDTGWKIIESRGFKRREEKGGGFEHEVGLDLIEDGEKKQGNCFKREIDLFGKRLDGKSTNPKTGQSTFYNVGVSDPVREAENLVEIVKIPVVQQNKLVFVARDARFANQVQKILKAKDRSGNLLKQVEIKTIADFVDT
jgi:hypothetical protein